MKGLYLEAPFPSALIRVEKLDCSRNSEKEKAGQTEALIWVVRNARAAWQQAQSAFHV